MCKDNVYWPTLNNGYLLMSKDIKITYKLFILPPDNKIMS